MKKILCLILTCFMLFTLSIGVSAYTINKDDAQIGAGDIFGITAVYFEDATVEEGKSVTVDVILESNPSVTEISISLELPAGITLTAAENGDMGTAVLSGNTVTVTSDTAFSEDGCIAKLTFTASVVGEKTVTLTATAKNGNDEVVVNGSSCIITVTESTEITVPGDVNGNGKRDTTDLAILKLFLATDERGEDVVNPDVDGDGKENTSDLAALKLMLAGAI